MVVVLEDDVAGVLEGRLLLVVELPVSGIVGVAAVPLEELPPPVEVPLLNLK